MHKAASWILKPERWKLPAAFRTVSRPVFAVSAPAGYGKSTLLSEWREEVIALGYRVVWLLVDGDDQDGDKLAIDLLHAFSPADTERSQSLVNGVGDRGKRAVIMALVAEMASRQERTVLFVDDVHWLSDNTAATLLRPLIRHQPERMALVLSGRANLSSLSSEAALDRRLHVVDHIQLAFNQSDIAQILRQYSVKPRQALVQAIYERSEGWPAIVRLIAMTLHSDEESQNNLLQGLLERPQAISEYLSEVLLSQLPDRAAQLLLCLAMLRRFNGRLVAAATEMSDAEAVLAELQRRALPISRSNDAMLPYALHPIVRDFLLIRIRRQGINQIGPYVERALAWLTDNGRIDAAIDLSLDVGNVKNAAALIDHYARTMARYQGRHATFLYWANKLPLEALAQFPEIRVKQAWSLAVLRRAAEAKAVLAKLIIEFAEPTNRPDAASHGFDDQRLSRIRQAVELERCTVPTLCDRAQDAAPYARSWLSRWPDAEPIDLAIANIVVGCGAMADTDFEVSLAHLRTAQRYVDECKGYYVKAWVDMWLATVLSKQGRYRQALYECDEAVTAVATHLGGETAVEIMLHAIRAPLLYEMNRLEEAGAALEHGLTALIEQTSVDSIIMGHVALARLQNAQGSHLDALETLAEGEVIGRTHGLSRLVVALAAERIDLLLRHRELGQAQAQWLELQNFSECGPADAFESAMSDKAPRIESRIALLKGNNSVACELTEPALQRAIRTGQKRKQVELLLIRALAAQAGKEHERAGDALQRAIEVAMSEGYVRVFVDEGEQMRLLLISAAGLAARASSPTGEYLRQILAAFSVQKSDPKTSAFIAGAESLTGRELKILRRLQSDLSNRQLADTLYITEGTLKWHLKNIYGKLNVTNRLTAVTAGRKLGLLDS
ncbi:LuxR C-terminal-related transcriptional regulator [Methylibium petroleiphilum]|nr:LuxR C-terminal-related transcriptional regulator [Methylibium petroleiphilum]